MNVHTGNEFYNISLGTREETEKDICMQIGEVFIFQRGQKPDNAVSSAG